MRLEALVARRELRAPARDPAHRHLAVVDESVVAAQRGAPHVLAPHLGHERALRTALHAHACGLPGAALEAEAEGRRHGDLGLGGRLLRHGSLLGLAGW